MTQNRKLLISASKMRNYIGEKCEQKLYLNANLDYNFNFTILILLQKDLNANQKASVSNSFSG